VDGLVDGLVDELAEELAEERTDGVVAETATALAGAEVSAGGVYLIPADTAADKPNAQTDKTKLKVCLPKRFCTISCVQPLIIKLSAP